MDNAGISKDHWKIMFISGMGFFTDAYDSSSSASLWSAQAHVACRQDRGESRRIDRSARFRHRALLFGGVADMLGRKRIYGVEVLVLAAAIACAFSPIFGGSSASALSLASALAATTPFQPPS